MSPGKQQASIFALYYILCFLKDVPALYLDYLPRDLKRLE